MLGTGISTLGTLRFHDYFWSGAKYNGKDAYEKECAMCWTLQNQLYYTMSSAFVMFTSWAAIMIQDDTQGQLQNRRQIDHLVTARGRQFQLGVLKDLYTKEIRGKRVLRLTKATPITFIITAMLSAYTVFETVDDEAAFRHRAIQLYTSAR